MSKNLITVCVSLMLTCFAYAQDKIYKKDGEVLKCNITDVLDEKVFYKLIEGNDVTQEILKANIDIIKYADGKMEDYSSIKAEPKKVETSSGGANKFDRNSDEFVNYANSIAKQVGEEILRKCAGRYDNSNTSVYFDAVYKDPYSEEISIPIRISYQKGFESNDRFIKGAIKIRRDGSKIWVYQDSQNILFTGCAKEYIFK
jgi:hypothetical protein